MTDLLLTLLAILPRLLIAGVAVAVVSVVLDLSIHQSLLLVVVLSVWQSLR